MGFQIQSTPVLPQDFLHHLEDPACGAVVQFEGRIRNHNDGLNVNGLHYEAHADFAEAEGNRILTEAQERFAIGRCHAVHRIGSLGIGEIAVWVGVSSPHRQEAFLACRWIMDEIKQRAAIWKKEEYSDVDPKWVGIADTTESDASEARYQRQVNLPHFGTEGQQKLKNAKVLVAGCGGLGCPALQSLVAMGVGTITLCDGDRIALDNLPRQILFGDADLGRNKAEAAADKLRQLNPGLSFRPVAEMITSENVDALLENQDVILDCADNFGITYLLNDAGLKNGIPLIQASVHQFEGQLNVFLPESEGGCYRCLWPEMPAPGCVQNCAEAGILATTTTAIGNQQAMEAVKLLLGWKDLHHDCTLLTDLRSGITRRLTRKKNTDCPTCNGRSMQLSSVKILELHSPDLHNLLSNIQKVDLREEEEISQSPPSGSWTPAPRMTWEALPQQLDKSTPVLCACSTGIRAQAVGEWLQAQGYTVYIWKAHATDVPQND
mgnify:CR=1 FL=1